MNPEPASTAVEVAALVRRLLAGQRARRPQGGGPRGEHHPEQAPALADHPDAQLDLIYQEMMLREQQGEVPTLDEYLARFPHLAEQLKVQFELEKALAPDSVLSTDCFPAPDPGAETGPPPTL